MSTTAGTRLLTIGTVCRMLREEFPDISISKIRYLEDQGLLSPKRTRGGYRLFSDEDVDRLETILRLQRDEFLPLRVIRQELASPAVKERRRRRASLEADEHELDLDELCVRAGVTREQARELVDYGLLEPDGSGRFADADGAVAAICGQLLSYGLAPAHLRKFATAADNQADLLQALVAPSLRSQNPERRQRGVEDMHALAEQAQELSQLLFWRALRQRVHG